MPDYLVIELSVAVANNTFVNKQSNKRRALIKGVYNEIQCFTLIYKIH